MTVTSKVFCYRIYKTSINAELVSACPSL